MPERNFKWNDVMVEELDGLVRSRAQVGLGIKFTVDEKVAQLRHLMARLEQDERVAVLDAVFDGCCRHCLRAVHPGEWCQCWNDD